MVRRQGDGTFVADHQPMLNMGEQRRRVGRILAHAAAEAVHFRLNRQELHQLLDAEIHAIEQQRGSHES